MGCSTYNYSEAVRRTSSYRQQTKEETFKQNTLHKDMNPRGVMYRESCDSENHPNSYPIIIALDETGSMGDVPKYIIDNTLPEIINNIMKAGIADPQVMFMGIGDVEGLKETSPLQVGQFESGDELMEKWLRNINLEGRGGGNRGEDYMLAWYFAAYHTKIDSFTKRNVKGCLITIGDEPVHKYLPKEAIRYYIGDNVEEDLLTSQILEEASKKWDIYHIHISHDMDYYRDSSVVTFSNYLGEDNVMISDKEHVGDSITRIINNSYSIQNE